MTDSQKCLCLIDGSGYIFRAFYALPPMTRADGTPVGAVYGFVNMLLNLVQEQKCTHIAVVFDAARETFRQKIYSEYKKNRKETPPDLIPQFPLIREAVKTFGLPYVELNGYEADDLIATYARKATETGFQVTIVSADKDLMQLMTDTVSVYDPLKKKVYTDKDVLDKFGVLPDKVVDVQALMGDSSDNIPGARGIGPKTAAALIAQFDTVENLLHHLSEIPQEKRRLTLQQDAENIRISKKLATLDAFAPVTTEIEKFKARAPNRQVILQFIQENGFKSLLKKTENFENNRVQTVSAPSEFKERKIEVKQLKAFVSSVKKLFVVLEWDKQGVPTGLQLCDENKNCVHCSIATTETDLFGFSTGDDWAVVQDAFSALEPSVLKIGCDIKKLMHCFPCLKDNFFDVGLAGYNLSGSKCGHTVEQLQEYYCTAAEILNVQSLTCAQCAALVQVYEKELALFAQEEWVNRVYKLDSALIPILYNMENGGVCVNRSALTDLGVFFDEQLKTLEKEIFELTQKPFNINSPAQVGHILFNEQKLQGGKKTKTGNYVTDSGVLEAAAEEGNQFAKKVLEYRQYAKLKSTYIDALLQDSDNQENRVHTTYSLVSTTTGRLSSFNPNLQNIPIRSDEGKKIRACFVAKQGCKLICADYSQIELRLIADVANVTALKKAFLNGEDIHTRTAAQVFKILPEAVTPAERRKAKAINFGIIYGISAFGLSKQLGICVQEAKKYIESYFAEFPEIKQYMQDTILFAKQHGYVKTLLGRRCYIGDVQKSFGERAAINAPIQGGAADIIKLAMVDVVKKLAPYKAVKLLLQVHDELVFEVAEELTETVQKIIKDSMENAISLSIPLVAEVGIGDNWKEAH